MTVDILDKPVIDKAPAVPDGTAVYAIGDIHGRADLLASMHRRITRDAAGRAARRLVVVYLGDYVDRGPGSANVIDQVLDQVPRGFTPVCLRGNHERLMLDFLDDVSCGPQWLRNGGVQTFASYGIPIKNEANLTQDDLLALQASLRERLPARHVDFLKQLKITHVEGGYLFVHAGIRPGVPLADQREEDVIWIRGKFLESTADHGHMVVHGHTIIPRPQFEKNRIGIDTGAYYSGQLTCLVLEGTTQQILQTGR